MPRGRVSMNSTTLATSLASIRLPLALASASFSSGQSASSEVMTGPGEIEPTRMPCLNTWRRTVCTKQFTAHLDEAYTGSHGVGKCAASELVTMMSPVPRSIMWGSTLCTFFITTLTFKFSMRSMASGSASTRSPPT